MRVCLLRRRDMRLCRGGAAAVDSCAVSPLMLLLVVFGWNNLVFGSKDEYASPCCITHGNARMPTQLQSESVLWTEGVIA